MTLEKWVEHNQHMKKYLQLEQCPNCGKLHSAKLRRQNTMYEDEYSNYVYLCDDCYEMSEEYWEEMWQDYYSSRL